MCAKKKPTCSPPQQCLNVPDSLREKFNLLGETKGIVDKLPEKHLATLLNHFKALSDRNRLKIFGMITIIPSCACMLKEATGLSDSRLSYHIGILKETGLILGTKEKNWIIYSLTKEGKELASLLEF